MSLRSIWRNIVFLYQTWRIKQQIKRDDREGTGPLSARAYRTRQRGEPLTPEDQASLDDAEACLAKIRTADRKGNK
jgi:hypothetical protein